MAEKYGWRKNKQQDEEQQTSGKQNTEKTYGWRNGSSTDVATTVGTNITDRVNTWLQNHNNYISNYQNRNAGRNYDYSDSYVRDSADWLTKVSQQKSAFDAEADSILSYMDQYKGYLDENWMNSVRDTLTSARSQQSIVLDNSTNDNEWWSNFANEDEYKTAQRYDGYSKKYSGQKYDDIQKAFAMLEDGEEKNWLAANQYDLYKNDTKYNSKATSGYKTFEAQKIVDQERAAQESMPKWQDAVMDGLNYYDSIIGQVSDMYKRDTSWREPSDEWDEKERKHFGYLYAEDPEKAYKYAEQVNNYYNSKEKYDQQQAIGNWASQNAGTGILGTLGAIASAPMGVADFVNDIVEYGARGTITQGSMLTPFEAGQAAQSGVANKLNGVDPVTGEAKKVLNENVPVFGGKGWGDVYSLGVSAANSLVSAYTLGGVGTLVNFIGQGGAAGVDDALSRGATAEQALLYGTIVGAAEGLTEMIPADELVKVGYSATIKNFLKKSLKQGIGEFAEEGVSSLIGNVADNLIMGSKSNFYSMVEEIMENNPGMSEEEAKSKAWDKIAQDAVFDAIGGFASGAANAMTVGGVSTAWDALPGRAVNKNAVQQYGELTDDLIQKGLQSDQKSESYQLAKKYQQQTQGKDGKPLTGFQIRNLVAANERQFEVENFNETRTQAKDLLKEYGENASEVWPIAELVAKKVTGQELTRAEKGKLARSQYGSRVAKEMTTVPLNVKHMALTKRVGNESRYAVSESGKATIRATEANEGKDISLNNFEVSELTDGQMTVKLESGEEVYAGDIEFPNESTAFAFSGVADIEHMTPAAATAMIKAIDLNKSVGEQLDGMDEAFTYGYNNYSVEDMKAGDFTSNLTTEQKMSAYKLGQSARAISDEAHDAPLVQMRTAKQASLSKKEMVAQQKAQFATNDVEVYFEDGGNVVKFDEAGLQFDENNEKAQRQLAGVNTAKFLSKMGLGGKFYFYQSYESSTMKDANGNPVRVYRNAKGEEVAAPNGLFKAADGSIHIDLNAGAGGEGTTLFTLGHEATHFVKKYSRKQFKILADLVTEAYDKTDISMRDRVAKKQKELYDHRNRGKVEGDVFEEVSYDEAFEEVVADAMSTMFTDGNIYEKIAEIKARDKGLFNTIRKFFRKLIAQFKKAYEALEPDQQDAQDIRQLKDMFDRIQDAFAQALVESSENFHAMQDAGDIHEEMSNEAAFQDSKTAVLNQIRPPYTDGSKAFDQFVEELNPEARKTFDLFYGFYQKSRVTNTLSVSGKKVKGVNISSLYLLADEWNEMLSREQKWADAAKALADFLPENVRKRMNMNEDGSLNPTMLEKEFKMPSSMAQRLVDALAYEKIDATYKLGDKTITLPTVESRQSVGGEAYRRAIIDETRKLFAEGKLKKVVIGTMSKDRWGSLGFLAANGKTVASGDFTTVCPQMMFNRGCWYCYRRAAMEKGVNNKLVANSVWYTGEILRIKDSDIESLNRNGGLRIQSFGDWMPHFSAMLADVLYDAELRGLQVKIITKEPSMINYIAALREQGIGKNLYFNLSADYTIERGPARQAKSPDSLDTVNPERPYLRNTDNGFWWKRAMTVEEANKYRQKYPWVNTRIVATTQEEFIRGLKDSRVDVVTGYHGNIRNWERIDSTTGEHKVEVEALGDAGMPRFAFNPLTNQWVVEYEGKTSTHKKLAQAIAENNLQMEYYTKTCCITGRCATCEGKCGKLARDFNVKNATNRDAESVAYWQKQMQYAIEPEFGDMTVDEDVKYSDRISAKDSNGNQLSKEQQEFFKDSKFRDEYGNLLAVYHGTDADFNVFNKSAGQQGRYGSYGIFFADKETASSYGNVKPYYLNANNVLEIEGNGHYGTWIPYEHNGKRMQGSTDDIAAFADENGYDGVIIHNVRDNADNDSTRHISEVYVVFEQNQMKLATNKNPTSDPDIRYSDRLYMDAVKAGDMETAQRMVDEASENAGFGVRGHHGTTNLFYVFDTAKSNIENDWGRGIYATTSEEDAEANYASDYGADLTNRIERLAEMMENWEEYEDMDYEQRIEAARKQLSQGLNKTLNVAFRMENPVIVERGTGGTFFTYESEYDEDLDEYSEPSGTLIDLIEGMKDIINEDYEWASYDADKLDNLYEEAVDFGGLSAIQVQSSVADWLVDVTDEDGNMAHNEILRAALERMGYDGIVDKSVPYKFGALSGRRFGGMSGVVEGTTHYIAFNSSQVKLTDPVTYDDNGNVIPLSERFNPKNDDIRYSERVKVNTEGMDENAKAIIKKLEIRAIESRYRKGVYASYSAERIERELYNSSSATQMDYAKSYIAWVDADEFLNATTYSQDGRDQIEQEAGELDLERLRNQTQPIHLTVDFETGKIVGHEGRHRMTALRNAGVEKVAVIFDAWNDDRHNTKPVDMMRIEGQEFDRYHIGLGFYVHDMLPLSKRYADAAKKLFSEVNGSIKFSERTGHSVSNRALLANAFEGLSQNSNEYKLIQQYKGHIAELNSLERKLSEFNREIRKIRFGKDVERDAQKLARLESEAKKIAESINKHDKEILSLEASEPLRKVIEREKAKARDDARQKSKAAMEQYRLKKEVKQSELLREVRETRAALKNHKNETSIMEKEFIRIAKAYEKLDAKSTAKSDKDTKTIADLKAALKEETKKHRDDQKTWDAEFSRLLREYELADRNISKLEAKIERQKQVAKNKVESRRKAELRHKISNFKKNLEAKLLRPTDRQYVPVDLIGAMVEVCNLIDTDTDLYKPNGEINKSQAKRDETKEKLQNLKDAYENLKNNSDPIYAGEFDEMVYTYLKELRDQFSSKTLNEMTLDELDTMYEYLRSIDETLADARKLIGWGDAENVYEAGDSIVAEQNAITNKRKNGKRNAVQKSFDTIDNLGLSPVRNVERMSGYNQESSLLKLFKQFEYGIRKKNKFKMDAYKSFEHLTSGKEYEDAIYKEVGGKKYTDIKGRSFGISKMQMMQSILSWERETANKNLHHIERGGFTFADLDKLRKGNLKDAVSAEYSHRVPVAVEMVAEFMETLKDDKWCQDYMAAARKFFNETAKDAINETSIALKHRILAKDKNYIPFEVDKNFVNTEITDIDAVQQTINSYGMLKDTKNNAPQALYITGLNNILDRHIEQVGTVYGLAIEVRNFNKVWNVRSKDGSGNDPTVKESIDTNWGKEGVKHIEQAVKDIQGSRVRERNPLYDKAKSGYIGATFLLNLSVVTKQIGSLFSSTSMLGWRDPASMIGNLVYTMANHKKIAAEVDKYTATAWMRRQGMSDAELYTLTTQAKKPGLLNKADKLPAVFNPTKWITAMDHAVALSLWKYAKQDTAKKTGLKGEELLKATAAFYDEVIENTQSMTDVLHRPEIQKRGDILSESFAMFKTDLYQMAGQLQATTGRFVANKSKENGKALARTAYAIAMGAVWGQLMTTVFALMRYKVDRYRDDEEDELSAESWLKRQGFGLAGDLMGYVFPIFGSEIVGAFENIMYGEADDVVDNIALTAVNDLYSTMMTIGKSIKDGEMPDATKMRKLAAKALQVFGVPANNILRTWEAIQLHAEDIANGEFFSFNAGAASKTDKLYKAIINGDKTSIDSIKSTYKTDDAYHTAVRKALRENDTRIHEAAQAKYQGKTEEYKRIFREIQKEGKFSFDDIMSAINSEETKIRNGLEPEKVSSSYNTADFVEAVSMGYTSNAQAMREDILSAYVANGKTQAEAEKAFASAVATSTKEAYSSGLLDEAMAENMLVEYAGKDEEKAASKVSYWAFIEKNPKYKDILTESNVEFFHEFAEPAEISLDVFVKYLEGTKGLTTKYDAWGDVEVTKKEQVLEVIDSLPLTWQQKDALYLAAGYAEDKIWDVPW